MSKKLQNIKKKISLNCKTHILKDSFIILTISISLINHKKNIQGHNILESFKLLKKNKET